MNRRNFVLAAGSLAATVTGMHGTAHAAQSYPPGRYAGAMVIDALGAFDELDANGIADVKASGITALNLTVGAVGNSPGAFADTIASIAEVEGQIAAHPDLLLKVTSTADLLLAKRSGRLGVILGFQDTSMLEGDLARLTLFRNLGVRIVQLSYNRRNLMADGCLEPADGGLSSLGRECIAEINRLRLLLDLSHAGVRTITEGIAACKGPLAITHTGCRALVDVPRNTHDRDLKALADKGGVAGIYFMPFLRASGQPHGEDLIRHLEHAVKVCGEDHVGLGTDGVIGGVTLDEKAAREQREFFEGRVRAGIAAPGEAADVFNLLPEYNEPRRFLNLADDLLRRGWSTGRVEKILGANFARLFRDVWGP